ncbi:MAG TPA: SRPBCC domain-containing protein [Candidatus Micrarchaeia archaeon]|nr:SRPBCC domain-containing protein [Candidatus Micrarchaeia archaeon]
METSVVRELELAAPLEAVWRHLTDPDRLTSWLAPEAVVEARPGGRVHCRWADGAERVGTVEVADPPRRLRLRWGPPEDGGAAGEDGTPAATTVEFTLAPVGAGTLLRVTEAGIRGGLGAQLCASLSWQGLAGRLARRVAGSGVRSLTAGRCR